MKVLALTTNTAAMAATRYRLAQYEPLCRPHDINLEIRPFLDEATERLLYQPGHNLSKLAGLAAAARRRITTTLAGLDADLVYVMREACLMGLPWVETSLAALAGKPMIYDLDDPVWLSYRSPTYGKLAMLAKMPGKANFLMRMADAVIAGNDFVAAHARHYNKHVTVVPTVVDTDRFRPTPAAGSHAGSNAGSNAGFDTGSHNMDELVTLGWIGSHSTTSFMDAIIDALDEAARQVSFRLVVVGASHPFYPRHFEVDNRSWSLDREIADFQSLDIGLYPMEPSQWAMGKSGLKAVQYGAVGIPTIASPVGAVNQVVEQDRTGLLASTPAQWRDAVVRLVSDPNLRTDMGNAARKRIEEQYSLAVWAPRWLTIVQTTRHSTRSHW